MPDHDVMGEFFEDAGLAWEDTQFTRVYWLPGHPLKEKTWTREDEEAYDLVSLSMEYMRERAKGFGDDN